MIDNTGILLDQDPNGRRVKKVDSLDDLGGLHPGLEQVLRRHRVNRAFPLQRGLNNSLK